MARRDSIPAPSGMAFALMSEQRLRCPSFGPGLASRMAAASAHLANRRLPLLCESRDGYQNLCQLITRFKMRETTKREGAATFDDLQKYRVRSGLSHRWR